MEPQYGRRVLVRGSDVMYRQWGALSRVLLRGVHIAETLTGARGYGICGSPGCYRPVPGTMLSPVMANWVAALVVRRTR